MSLRIESSVVPWLIVAAAPALALAAGGCGEDFESCVASRTCPAAGSGGNAGEAGAVEAPLGGSSGTGGSRGGAAGTSGNGEPPGDGGASGDSGDGGSAARGGAGAGGYSENGGDSGRGGEGGETVEPTDPCEGVTCERGVCANFEGQGVCECESGFAGKECDLPSFEWIELLPGHDYANVFVLAENGTVLGTSCDDEYCGAIWLGFRWTHEDGSSPMGDLGILAIDDTNRDASVVVGSFRGMEVARRAFRWTEASGFVSLGVVPGADASSQSDAHGVSADGSVIVGSSGQEPFRWTLGSGMVKLALPDGRPTDSFGRAVAISNDGSAIAGQLFYSGTANVLRWTGAGVVEWIEPSRDAKASGMSADGEVIVGYADFAGVNEAFRWTRLGGIVSLGRPSQCANTYANAVSGDGRVVVVSCSRPDGTQSYLWDVDSGFRRVEDVLESIGADLSGVDVIDALKLSFDGTTILGNTIPSEGSISRTWIARLPDARE